MWLTPHAADGASRQPQVWGAGNTLIMSLGGDVVVKHHAYLANRQRRRSSRPPHVAALHFARRFHRLGASPGWKRVPEGRRLPSNRTRGEPEEGVSRRRASPTLGEGVCGQSRHPADGVPWNADYGQTCCQSMANAHAHNRRSKERPFDMDCHYYTRLHFALTAADGLVIARSGVWCYWVIGVPEGRASARATY